MEDPDMKRLQGHLIGIAQGSEIMFSDFAHNGPMWVGQGPREKRSKITFDEAFKLPPAINVSMSMWDTDGQVNQRADIAAEDITETGFSLVFRTWGDSRVARVRADWMAIGEVSGDDEWDIA